MGRPFTATERAKAAGQELAIFGKFEVEDPNGAFQDVSSLGGLDWFNSAQVSDGIDQNSASITVTLQREVTVIPPENYQLAHYALNGVLADSQGTNNGTGANLSRTNSVFPSRDLSGTWTRTGTGTNVFTGTGLDGVANTATVLSDTDAAVSTFWARTLTVPVDSNTHVLMFAVLKDAITSRFPLFAANISGGTGVGRAYGLNTQTGALTVNNAIGTGSGRVVDGSLVGYPTYWFVELTVTNNSTALNTTLTINIYAAYGSTIAVANAATTGSITLGQVQVELGYTVVASNPSFTLPPIYTTGATVTNANTVAPGKLGSAQSFDGLNEHITVPDIAAFKYTGQDFSAFMWVTISGDETTAGYLISKPWNASGEYNWQLLYNVGSPRTLTARFAGATVFTLTTAGTISSGVAHHVGFTIEAATKVVRIYVDGVVAATGTHVISSWVPGAGDANSALTIGNIFPYGAGWTGDNSFATKGLIEDVRIYSDALSPAEVNTLFTWTGTKSLAPFVTASTINRLASGAYGPFLDLGRKFKLGAAIVLKGSLPFNGVAGTWTSSGVTLASTAALANNGDLVGNAWHTDTAVPGAYVQVDMGVATEFDQVRTWTNTVAYAGIYKIRGSPDGSTWTDIATGFNPSLLGMNVFYFTRNSYRWWRLELTNTPGPGSWLNEAQFNGDWKELTQGYIDSIDWGGKARSVVSVGARDLSARLLDTYISVRRTYGSAGGTAMETVLQQYLTDNVPVNTPILSVPVSPSFPIFTFVQDYANLMDAMNEVAIQAGFLIRYRYNATGQLLLTLYKPDRTLTNGVTFNVGPEEYIDIPGLKIAIDGIRTYVELRFIDASTGQLTLVTSPSSFTSASITKYGKRYMAIDEQNGSQINSLSAAQAMVDAVRSDLEEPGVQHQLQSFLMWWIQLSDYVQFNQNTILYDTAQFGAITGYTHILSGGTGKTTFDTRGKPAGGYRSWLSYAKALGGEYIAPRIVPAPGAFQIAAEDGAFGYLNFVFDDPQRNVTNFRVTTIAGRTAAVTGSPTTPAAVGSNVASVGLVDKLASYIDVDWYGIDSDGTNGALLGHMRFTFGLGARPLPPDVAYTTIPDSTFPNGGILSGAASIDNDTVSVRFVASKTGKPSASDVNAASPIAVGVGSTSVTLGTLLTGLNTGDRYWIAVRCYNSSGLESDLTEITDVYVAGSSSATAAVILQSTTPSSSSIKFTVTPNNHCAEFEIYIKEYDGANTDPGTAAAVDAGYPTPLDAIVVGADATKYRAQPGVNYDIVVPIAAGTNWIFLTVVPYDAIARQGLKLNAKGRGNGTAPPLPPISTTIDPTPTATSITNQVTLATPRADRVKMYRDNVWFGALVNVSASANGALVALPADTGLTPSTTYLYTYAGVDSATGIESVGRTSPVSVTTAASATIPTPTLASGAYNPATETWSFTVTPAGGTPAGTVWHIERATTSGGAYTLRAACDNTSTSLSESDPMDTTLGTDYYFKCYGSLSGWTTSVHSAFVGPIHKTGTGEPASAPTIGTMTNPSTHQVQVSWTNPSDTIDRIYFEFERLQSGVYVVAASGNVAAASTSSGNIGIITVGVTYRARVRYYNAVHNGPWSTYTAVIGPIT